MDGQRITRLPTENCLLTYNAKVTVPIVIRTVTAVVKKRFCIKSIEPG